VTVAQWVLTCGEVLFDVVSKDAVELHAHVSGGPANAALAMAQAGLPVAVWAGRPSGVYGERLAYVLREGGVSLEHFTPSALPPTVSLASPRGTSVAYELYAEGTSAFDVRLEDAPIVAPDGSPFALVHLGGLGTAIQPMADALRASAPMWRGRGTLIGYDPNMRDGLENRGQSLAEIEDWFGRADIVKVSTEDLDVLYPAEDRGACVARILDFGARLVILTDGPGPVQAFSATASAVRDVEPWPAEVLPAGAGDAFISGVYAELLRSPFSGRGASSDELLRLLDSGLASTLRQRERINGVTS